MGLKKVKALGLCSGGLDSILAALVLRRQGIYVQWVAFETPFFSAEKAQNTASKNNIPLIVKDITDRYIPMLKNPRCGYGQGMNPCLDCHALMFRIAGEMMAETGSDFIFSGEVLGQRPMSQTKSGMRYVEKHSGYDGYILRPLSARCLPETRIEKEGLVDRELLYGLTGRSRKPQIALAEEFGVAHYPAPAGGCLLTDKGYASRLKDFLAHQADWTRADLELLKHGRHLRVNASVKLIVGRNQADNEAILAYYRQESDVLIRMASHPGPVGLIPHGAPEETVRWAASVCAGYSKAPAGQSAELTAHAPDGGQRIQVAPIPNEQVQPLMIP
ncbi:MAG: tRNA 4-thiouridine(8) synthase ThiI [Desulfobacterales bacterium]|nr:tRNA 4-thiouridine(8) synthase ThiI [Desulfobacterales bacterium]